MSLRLLRTSHRVRMTLAPTLAAALLAAVILAATVQLVRASALSRRWSDLETGLARVVNDSADRDLLTELRDDLPGVDVAVYRPDGSLAASTSRRPPAMAVGRSQAGGQVQVGVRISGLIYTARSPWTETEQGITQLGMVLTVMWLLVVVLTAGVTWMVSGRTLKPVRELMAAADILSQSGDGALLRTTDGAEFAELTHSLNRMIERVRHSAAIQEQFAVDAAHELRTPLALLQTRLETNLQRPRSVEEHVAAQQQLLGHLARLRSLAHSLLLTAAGRPVQLKSLALDQSVRKAALAWADLRGWPEERLMLTLASVAATADEPALQIILANLLDNAAAHSPQSAPVQIEVGASEEGAFVEVFNEGSPISAEDAERIFSRFFRLQAAADTRPGGAGLGLAVVRRLAESMGAAVQCLPCSEGARFRVEFPLLDKGRSSGS